MSRTPSTLSGAFVVLSGDPGLRSTVVAASTEIGRHCLTTRTADEMVATLTTTRATVVVIDGDHAGAAEILRRLVGLPGQPMIVLVLRDPVRPPPPGAHVLVLEPALGGVLRLVTGALRSDVQPPIAFEYLLSMSVLTGSLDEALENAAERVAASFAVERCLILVRGDSTGGPANAGHTWDSLAWKLTSERFRASASAATTLIAPSVNQRSIFESYLAVPLDTPFGSGGSICLTARDARIFSREARVALQAIASRISAELGWRAAFERTTDEVDRLSNGPGLDPLLDIWNRVAMDTLATMQVAGAQRAKEPLAVIVLKVVDLATVNTRYGLNTGDRLLRRVADSLRAAVRADDLIGRVSGDLIAIVLQRTLYEGARRLAERLQAALAARPLELPSGESVDIEVAVGVAALQPDEDAAKLIARATWAAKKARQEGIAIVGASTGPAPRLSSQGIDIGEVQRATLGGAYRLLHEISRGGMGVVYRAEDLALERQVAIKMLRPDLAEDRGFVEQLRREAALLARLQHPNLVQIYNFGQIGGDSYFVMELVEGEGLQQAIDRHRLEGSMMPLGEVVSAIEQVASALDALHDRGIIHRDVKPANVIRDPFRGRSVLVDVGIARRYGQSAEIAGTPGYVAPEVVMGQEATLRSDVYGLAATAYTLLTLVTPWGDGEQILSRQVSGADVQRPSSHNADLAAIDEVMVAALHVEPHRRPASAGAFARGLASGLSKLVGPSQDIARWAANAVVQNRAPKSAAKTRGVVFRSVPRALGMREAEKLRDAIGGAHPTLSRALADTAPLSWIPTDLFTRLLEIAPAHVGRDSVRLARDIARATVRASFRRFFPASAATLAPDRTLSAIRNVWGQYQSWGTVSCMPVHGSEVVVRIAGTPRHPDLCAWTSGMLEQLVVLSGGSAPTIDHEACETRGNEACLYRVSWKHAE